jgi:hypothetical protein
LCKGQGTALDEVINGGFGCFGRATETSFNLIYEARP